LNFLAHIYLSGDNPKIQVGNFIGDFVKGRAYENYQADIRLGILMHRFIDSYTDNSATAKEAKKVFEPLYGRFSGIVSDVVLDHFLSINWHLYSQVPLRSYIHEVHRNLWNYRFLLPPRGKKLLPSLIYRGYLLQYVSLHGIENVLSRMALRTVLPDWSAGGVKIIRENYLELNNIFLDFMNELRTALEVKFPEVSL